MIDNNIIRIFIALNAQNLQTKMILKIKLIFILWF